MKQDPNEKVESLLGMFSVLEMIPYSENTAAANKLLTIMNYCNQSSLIVLADTQDDVKELLGKSSPSVIEILQNSFY